MTTPPTSDPAPEAPRPAQSSAPQPSGTGPRPFGGRPSGPGGPPRGGPRREGGGGGRRFYPRRKVCFFCANKDATMDYKIPEGLRRYVSERARIEPRRKTGTCARHQRLLSKEIKRARQVGLIPFTTDTLRDLQPSR